MLNAILEKLTLTPMDSENLKASFRILWQGLLAIFIVIGLIILAVQLTKFCVNKAEAAKKAREAQKAEANAAANASSAPQNDGGESR